MRMSDLNALAAALEGVPVSAVLPDGPAALAGVRFGDVILEVGDRRVKSLDDYVEALDFAPQAMRLKIFRQGDEIELVVHRDFDRPLLPGFGPGLDA